MIQCVIGDDETEKGLQLGVSVPFGGFGVPFCDDFQEVVEIFTADGRKIFLPKEFLEMVQQVAAPQNGPRFEISLLVIAEQFQGD